MGELGGAGLRALEVAGLHRSVVLGLFLSNPHVPHAFQECGGNQLPS